MKNFWPKGRWQRDFEFEKLQIIKPDVRLLHLLYKYMSKYNNMNNYCTASANKKLQENHNEPRDNIMWYPTLVLYFRRKSYKHIKT
jgi:hypothetical protein